MPPDAAARPRILLAMIEAGGGHRAPALALRAAFERLHPGRFEIDVLDFMRHVGPQRLDARHKAAWGWMLAHPRVTFALQTVMDAAVPVGVTRAVQGWTLRDHSRRAGAFVAERGYRLVVALHFMPLQAIQMARARGEVAAPLVGIDTDPFEGHALWAEPGMDEMIVASEEARALLVRKGVPRARTSVFGYPMSLAFADAERDRATVRARLGIAEDRFVVLHTVGGEGIGGDVVGTARALLAADLPLEYVVVTGRNEALRARLQALADGPSGRLRLRPLGFTDAMPAWIVASDVVLAKAGAASTFEPLALGRPVFHTHYVAPNEKKNLDFCVRMGVGGSVPRPADVVALLQRLTHDPAPLHAMRGRIEALALRPGARDIAEHLVERYLGGA